MHKLASIEIVGFRGQQSSIRLDLKSDANFLIGRNGTGKTTLINLIAAGLDADLALLRDAKFEKIEFQFWSEGSRKRPRVLISKRLSEDHADEIVFRIKDSATSNGDEYVFPRLQRRYFVSTIGQRIAIGNQNIRTLRERLGTLFKATWLSLQRAAEIIQNDESENEDEISSPVERRLNQVLNQLARYFSRLDRRVADQTQEFQKRWFLSFLANERAPQLSNVQKINLNDEKATLTAIFEKFNMSAESYQDQLDKHFQLAEQAKNFLSENKFKVTEYVLIFDTLRLHSLVEQWQELQEVQKKIYHPKTEFIKIASEMLYKKRIEVNRSNQIIIESDNGVPIPVRNLSSGEKQLLIFLSETLLQEQEAFIFLADEPELSLHVEWQEELVPNLLKINPNAQVLFATHSPDVVNKFQSNLFKMEEMTS